MRKDDIHVRDLIFTGLWIAVVTVITMSVVIPIPMTQGYVNLGDAAVFLGAFLLGRRNGAIAAGLGSALADILLSYASFAPFTLVIKAAMAFIFGSFLMLSAGKVKPESKKVPFSRVLGIALATVVLAGGYYAAEWILTGNSVAPIVSIPWNILQGGIGGGIALLLMTAMGSIRMPARQSANEETKVKQEEEIVKSEEPRP
jgi:uncharacterized membrane protein